MSPFNIALVAMMQVGLLVIVVAFLGAGGRDPILKVMAGIAIFALADLLFLVSIFTGWGT